MFLLLLSQSMEVFQQRLADAEKAVYGQRRGEEGERDGSARGGWRKGENGTRERCRRREGDTAERDHWKGNESRRHSSPADRERCRAERREERERGEHRGGGEERVREGDRLREKDRDRDRERDKGREREGDRRGDQERDRDRERDRSSERNIKRERSSVASSSSSSTGVNWSNHPPSLGSLKSRFLKPSDNDSGDGESMSKRFLNSHRTNCTAHIYCFKSGN